MIQIGSKYTANMNRESGVPLEIEKHSQSTGPRVILVCSGSMSNTSASMSLMAGLVFSPAMISPFRNVSSEASSLNK